MLARPHRPASLEWWRPSIRIVDLVVPDAFEVLGVQVGAYSDWTADGTPTRSDHVPIVVDLG